MSKNLTEVLFIIDKSGSMQGLVDDTIGGFNSFIESQKELEGTIKLTTVLFSSGHYKLHNGVDVREIEGLSRKDYSPGGMTAMLDAIGDSINELQKRIDDTPVEERPKKVVCVITTDGQENSSHMFTKSQVQTMIEHQTKGHGWEFVFLGANMDAVTEAGSLGINYAATYIPDSIGTSTVYAAATKAVADAHLHDSISSDWCHAVSEYANASVDGLKQ